MAGRRGKDFVLYINTSLTATPTWLECTDVKDVSRKNSKSLADASTRGSSYRQQKGTLKELEVTFQMVYDPEDTARVAIEDAYYEDDDIDVAALDGPIATIGSAGIRFLAQVSDFSGDEALEDMGLDNVTLIPTYTTDLTQAPRRVSVTTAGTITDTVGTTREGRKKTKQNHAHEPAHTTSKAG